MQHQLELANVKCGGCGNSIRRALAEIEGVTAVELDVASGGLSFESDPASRAVVASRLLALGYPERGSVEGIAALAAGAKSFVSCAIGRISGE